MTGWIRRMAGKFFTAEALGLMLVLVALLCFAQGIASSLVRTATGHFFFACFVAAILSLGLAKRHWKPYRAAAVMAALGVGGVWIIGARLTVPLIDLLRSVVRIIPQLIAALQSKTAIDLEPVKEAWKVIAQASGALALRFQLWLAGFNGKVQVNDALLRGLIWVFILWVIAAWIGWFTARRNATTALLPAMLLLAFVSSYSERSSWALWGLVCAMLLLMGVWNYKNHIGHWESSQVDYSESIRSDSTLTVLLLAGLIGWLAFITPSVSWQQIRDYFRSREQNRIAAALGVQTEPPIVISIPLPRPDLPREHLLHGGFATSEKLVMTIRTGELPPNLAPSGAPAAPRYYWRSLVYDEYLGTGWISSSVPSQKYAANTPLLPGLPTGYKALHLDVQLVQPEGKLFWSGMLFGADTSLTARWRVRPTLSLFADQSALLQADLFAAASDADYYTVESFIPDVTLAQLRAASAEYPEEIRARYLQLPPDLPERVRRLAGQITEGRTNAYDKAKAIETYLRTNYPYDLDIPAPPTDRDVVDYFLFDLRRGYCDYYATAMVVLARASGLPARFVSGYAPGSYDPASAQYVIRERDAHSWAEVYFPEIGWVEFEPTASISEITRPADDNGISADTPTTHVAGDISRRLLARFLLKQIVYLLLPLAILLISFVFYFALVEPWWYLRHLSPSIAMARIYRRFYRASHPLMGTGTGAETALEYADRLIHKWHQEFSNSRIKRIDANTADEILQLTDLYYTVLFRNVILEKKDLHAAWKSWSHIRRRLWVARIVMSLRALFAKRRRGAASRRLAMTQVSKP